MIELIEKGSCVSFYETLLLVEEGALAVVYLLVLPEAAGFKLAIDFVPDVLDEPPRVGFFFFIWEAFSICYFKSAFSFYKGSNISFSKSLTTIFLF